MIVGRVVNEVTSVVGLAHDVPQYPFCLSRSFHAAMAAAFAGWRLISRAINGWISAGTTRPPVTCASSSSRNSRTWDASSILLMIFLHENQRGLIHAGFGYQRMGQGLSVSIQP